MKDQFTLHNLEVSVEGDPEAFVCNHEVGVAFRVVSENIVFDEAGEFSMYALATILPLLPAKQRPTDENDWMTTDELIACPDPNCGAQIRIQRLGETTLSHDEVTRVPLKPKDGSNQ